MNYKEFAKKHIRQKKGGRLLEGVVFIRISNNILSFSL